MRLFPKYIVGDLTRTARMFSDARFTLWGLAWGHWGIGVVRMTPEKLVKLRRSRSRAAQQLLLAYETQMGMLRGLVIGIALSAIAHGLFQVFTGSPQ